MITSQAARDGRTRGGASLLALAAACAAAALVVPGAALAAPGGAVKVAPGVFMASAADTVATELPERGDSRRDPRIVGGSTTTIAEWPWQAAIADDPDSGATGNGFQRQFCGGSLVAPTIVITAAHCVHDGRDFTDPDLYTAITGRTTLSSSDGQEIEFADYFYPVDSSGNPMYNDGTSEWDAVFAQLASASPSTNSTPIQIAGADEAGFWAPADENAWATGWGRTASTVGSRSDTLREVQIDMIADSTCSSPSVYDGDFEPETMVCAGEMTGGQDTCQGDSGGPLVVPVGGGTFRLVGDTSWGLGCAFPNFPGVYGRLAQDPMCSALRAGIQSVAGTDVVGPGGCVAGTPPPAGPPASPGPRPGPGGGPGGDAEPPETTIVDGPNNRTRHRTATFAFTSSEEGATFECALDGKSSFKRCTSPLQVRVRRGRHSFEVQATDQAGNTDGTPAADSWKVRKRR